MATLGPTGCQVGGWTNPSEKYERQIGSLPQVGVKMEKKWNHHPGASSSILM